MILGERVWTKAADKYGVAQYDKAIEELDELKEEIIHLKCKKDYDEIDAAGLVEEAADALIMIAQVVYLEDISDEVRTAILIKLHKLEQRMEREEW